MEYVMRMQIVDLDRTDLIQDMFLVQALPSVVEAILDVYDPVTEAAFLSMEDIVKETDLPLTMVISCVDAMRKAQAIQTQIDIERSRL